MEEVVPRLFQTLFIWTIVSASAAVFYLYRLEEIRGLKLSQAWIVLFLCRILDLGSFWWAFQSSGGEVEHAEASLAHFGLTRFLSSETAFLIGAVLTTAGFVLVLFLYHRLMRRWGLSVRTARRLTLAATAAISAASLFGTAANAAFALFGWQSPLLIG